LPPPPELQAKGEPSTVETVRKSRWYPVIAHSAPEALKSMSATWLNSSEWLMAP
jgi:hypothetical protein